MTSAATPPSFCESLITYISLQSRPNAWVSRATVKPPTPWARLAEPPAPSQAQNAAAVVTPSLVMFNLDSGVP
jgi:hypothetical protein